METEHALVPLLAQFVVAGPVGQADGHPAVASEREERPVTLVVALREADQVVAVGGVHPEQRGATAVAKRPVNLSGSAWPRSSSKSTGPASGSGGRRTTCTDCPFSLAISPALPKSGQPGSTARRRLTCCQISRWRRSTAGAVVMAATVPHQRFPPHRLVLPPRDDERAAPAPLATGRTGS